MNHQPYENMLLDDRQLTPDEKEKLAQHLEVCPQCTRLEQSLRALDHEFKGTEILAPAVGFSSRWQASLPAWRKQHEREQTRIILISMVSTAIASGITIGAILLPDLSPITVFANLFADLVRLVNMVSQFWFFIGSFFNAAPAGLSIGIAVTISIWLGFTLFTWGITLYRITLKGIRTTL
jgi:hypothetical protein